MMNQPAEYYIWVKDSNGMSWHGCKPVTKERGEKLVAKYSKRYPMNRYWLAPVEPPHAEAMREKARELWQEARDKIEHIYDNGNVGNPDTMTLCEIEDLQDLAIDLKHYASWPVEFAPPHGECNHVLPEQSCIYCQPKETELI